MSNIVHGAAVSARPNVFSASPLLWAAIALAVVVLRDVASDPTRVLDGFRDTDDALRLIELRDFLAGQGWFDMTIGRVGAPEALVSHWSRLVDAPLALIVSAAGLVWSASTAELVTLYAWPTFLLFVLMLVVARHLWREHGAWAAGAALFMVVMSVPALFQFRTGRIDHHSLQILCAVAGTLFLVRAFDEPRSGWLAGALLGVGLGVGLEPLPLIVAIIALATLIAGIDPGRMGAVARMAIAFAATLTAAFAVTVPPASWLAAPCDAIGLNLVAFAIVGAGAVAMVASRADRLGITARLGLLAAGCAAAFAAWAAIEPACIAGPFAKADPRIVPIWLDGVSETRGLMTFAREMPTLVIAFFASGAVAIFAAARLYFARPDYGRLLGLGVVGLAVVYGSIQVKLMPYAAWFAIPATAAWIAGLPANRHVSAHTLRYAALILLCPATLGVAAAGIVWLQTGKTAVAEASDILVRDCRQNGDHQRLATLEPGLVLADLNLGPFIAVNTGHRVVAAPYHRLGAAIVAQDQMLHGEIAESEEAMRGLGVDYVVLCIPDAVPHGKAGVAGMLRAGGVADFLEPVTIDGLSRLKVWRLRPAGG